MKNFLSFFVLIYITIGLGSAPEMPITQGGLITVSFSDKSPVARQPHTGSSADTGIVLFGFEL